MLLRQHASVLFHNFQSLICKSNITLCFLLFRSLLLALYKAYLKEIKYPIEFYLSLIFYNLSYNSELQNEIEIVYENKSAHKRLFKYRNYKEVGLTLPNFTIQTLMENIASSHIMEIVKLLLLERKIVIIGSNCGFNAILIESLLMLLLPLYCF